MTSRLPIVGSDDDTWGSILNSFLEVSHNSDGSLIGSAVSAAGAEMTANKGAANGYAPLDSNSLVPTANLPSGSSTPAATTSSEGIIQLAGDLSGTAASPTVPGLASKLASLTAANSTITVAGTSTAPTVAVNAIAESQVTNLSTDLASKIAASIATTKGDILAATGSATLARLGVGSDGQVLTAASGQTTGVEWTTVSGGGGISQITSNGETVTITNPTGPTVNLEVSGSTASLGVFNVLSYGATGNTKRLTDGAISASSHTFTSATANFSSGDVGKVITIELAGPSYGSTSLSDPWYQNLRTTISGFTNSTTVTLAAAATTTASSAVFWYGTDDTAAIQSCINAAGTAATTPDANTQTGRAMIVVPRGIYMLSYTLVSEYSYAYTLLLPSNVEVVGIGRPVFFSDQKSWSIPYGEGNGMTTITMQNSTITNFAVRGMSFDGGFRSTGTLGDVSFPDAHESFFHVSFAHSTHYEITDCRFIGCYGDGIRNGDNLTQDFLIHGNDATCIGGKAINVIDADRGVVSNNRNYDNQAAAGGANESITINGQSGAGGGVVLSGNISIGGGTIAALGYSNTVIGNYCAPLPGASGAFEVGAGTEAGNITVSGNVADLGLCGANSSNGIIVTTADVVSVTGNIVNFGSSGGGSQHGINMGSGTGSNTSVTGNTIYSAGATGGSDITGGQVITGNRCDAFATSIGAPGNGVVAGNTCKGILACGNQGTAGIKVQDNICTGLQIGGTEGIYMGNTITATTSSPIQFYEGDGAYGNMFINNIITANSGVDVSNWASGEYQFNDLFTGNIILGGAVLNSLNANQQFFNNISFNGSTWTLMAGNL